MRDGLFLSSKLYLVHFKSIFSMKKHSINIFLKVFFNDFEVLITKIKKKSKKNHFNTFSIENIFLKITPNHNINLTMTILYNINEEKANTVLA